MFIDYRECPCCKGIHDAFEGGRVEDEKNNKMYFVCLDCCEEYSDEEIIKRIEEGKR